MVPYFPGWYSLSSYAGVQAFVVILELGTSFSVCLVCVGILFMCYSFLPRFSECWLSVASFTDPFLMFKRDCWSMLKAKRGGGQDN